MTEIPPLPSTASDVADLASRLADALSRHPDAKEMNFEDAGWRIEARKIEGRRLQ